jgi:hypothetical protein
MGDGTEPIDNDELLYRRFPLAAGYYVLGPDPTPSPNAFNPRRDDETGISVSRAKYATPEQAAQNPRGKPYYIAVLRAGDLRAQGIEVVPRPLPDQPGHAEMPSLKYDQNGRSDTVEEAKKLLAGKLCREVLGPFP